MSISCPACGGAVEVTERTLPILAGACPNCSREVLLLAPTAHVPAPAGEGAVTPATEGASSAGPAEAAFTVPHPGEDCDGTLTLELAAPDRLVGLCDECGETITFVLSHPGEEAEPAAEGGAADEEEEEAPRKRAPRFQGGGFQDRRGPRPGDDRPPSRPCRQCGGPLAFETAEDGTVTGRCRSCGNTFTLPRRREGGGFGRSDNRERRPYNRGPPRRYGRGAPRDDRRGDDGDRPRGRRRYD